MKMAEEISAFYWIFGQSFEKLKQLMFRENEKNIGKTTVDLWRHKPRRRKILAVHLPVQMKVKCNHSATGLRV
jgi:hypothetical protein